MIGVTLLGGCASPAPRAYTPEQQAITAIDSITILPIVCTAKTRPEQMEKLLDKVFSSLTLDLALKGYVLRRGRTWSESTPLTGAQVAALSPAELATLGPSDSNHILVCFLGDLSTNYAVVAKWSDIKLSAILIDKRAKRVVWQNSSKSGMQVNILFDAGYLVIPFLDTESAAIVRGFRDLFQTIPPKPEKG